MKLSSVLSLTGRTDSFTVRIKIMVFEFSDSQNARGGAPSVKVPDNQQKDVKMKRLFPFGLLFSLLMVFFVPFGSHGSETCIKGDCRNGQGTRVCGDGKTYAGNWRNGRKHGHGKMTFGDGSTYSGEWKNNKKHGHGTLTRPGGSRYIGEWKNDEPHGQGTWIFTDGGRYVGQWEKSRFHGYGTYIYANGSKYEGEFKHGCPTQNGKWTYPTSVIQQAMDRP